MTTDLVLSTMFYLRVECSRSVYLSYDDARFFWAKYGRAPLLLYFDRLEIARDAAQEDFDIHNSAPTLYDIATAAHFRESRL